VTTTLSFLLLGAGIGFVAGVTPGPVLTLVGAPLLVQAGQDDRLAVPAFLVGYYITIVGSDVVLALALHRWLGLFSDRMYRGLLLFASGVLAAYGLGMVGRAATADR
jgi:hypothetical protein